MTSSHQFNVSLRIQKQVFWFEISVNNALVVEVGERLYNTARVEPGGGVIERTPKQNSNQ